MEQTYSNTSAGDKIGLYEFLEALGLLDNKFGLDTNTDDNDEFWLSDDDNNGFWLFDDTLKKLYQDREACQRLILLRLFTMRLPNLSEQAKNGLFLAFSRSNSFGVLEHNALLGVLAHPVKVS
ncbi:14936_t:CDS:2 [Racocetra fulgida]|uniref:14936_t:CDS:1 n=1 Tax=Racocetra fulgida TaxID=60492 RepID=A0A9N8VDL4_9GLOM|nr:14936_t:CDS:2 [Racocetra fulgida]